MSANCADYLYYLCNLVILDKIRKLLSIFFPQQNLYNAVFLPVNLHRCTI